MQTLAAGGLDKADKADAGKRLAQDQRGLDDARPRQSDVGIEIEGDAVGGLDIGGQGPRE